MVAEDRAHPVSEYPRDDSGIRLRTLTPSRKRLRPGDLFCVLPADGRYVFGRVIEVDIPPERAPGPACNLIYVYGERSDTKRPPPRKRLTPDRLLIPPMFINRLPWSRGYIETIAHWPLEPGDVLDQHCFRRFTGEYLDERGRRLPGPIEPCGEWGLSGYGALDEEVHEALGMVDW